jgi:uncharacterized protein DUF4062
VRDLGDLRSAVKYWLEEQGFIALISESADFPHALDREAAHAALSVIDGCDYYVLLIGTRRGSMFPDGDVSVTRAEFRHAREIRHAGGRLQMLCLARNELVAAARLGKPTEVEEAEWAEVIAFLEEVKTSSGQDEPNWVQPFGTFREVVDALTATLRISGPLRRRSLEANLMHEIVENVKRGLTKGTSRLLPTAYFLPDLAVSGQTVLQPWTIPSDRVGRTIMFRLFTISAGRMRSALEAAISSGEFLDYDSSKGAFRIGPVQNALLSLRTELTQLDHLLETMGSNKTVEEDFGRLAEAAQRKTDAQILGFTAALLRAAQAALLNSMSLGRALYRFFEGTDRALRTPDLLPAQLSDAVAERVKQEAVSDAEAEAWIRA